VNSAFRDRTGALWFGSSQGLSRLIPEPDRNNPLPVIRITGVRISGMPQPISEYGATEAPGITLEPNQNQVQIDYLALSFAPGDQIRYQYMLEGSDSGWGLTTSLRSVNYANLKPGTYRFLVRAVNANGVTSSIPAGMGLTIHTPILLRWWVQAPMAMSVILLVCVAYRYRIARLVELERVRTRLAADLHDDIGSGLAEIAIWSEIAKSQSSSTGADLLNDVADRARSLRESMSDIVWAVDPRRDSLADLVRRMKQSALGVLESPGGHSVEFLAPEDAEIDGIVVSPDHRRHVYLLFKEALTNIVRHAKATEVAVRIQFKEGVLQLDIQDNGCGFDLRARNEGHGIRSLRKRAQELRARLNFDSEAGRGTRIELTVPLRRR
jgi:two-component sensor histidine kinase